MEPTPAPTQPRLIRRLCHRLFTWRNARRVLVTLAVLATLITIFHAEENWRGRRAWENCKRELAAKGVEFDWSAYLPKPVADDQNIFKAPLMQERFVKGAVDPTGLYKRLNDTNHTYSPVPIADLTPQAARDFLVWSDQFQSEFDAIHKAVKRPKSRMEGDYEYPFNIPTPNFVMLRTLAQTLAKRAACHLVLGEPDQARAELTFLHDLCRMLDVRVTDMPVTLVASMINVAINGLYTAVIADGLQSHAWRESDLAALQEQLLYIDLPRTVAAGFRCEPVATCRTLEIYSRRQFHQLVVGGKDVNFWQSRDKQFYLMIHYGPRGWFYQNMVLVASKDLDLAIAWDASTGQIDPKKAEDITRQVGQISQGPYSFFAVMALPNYTKAWQSTACNQTMVNLALVSCALERHRLANGSYPATLDALAPQFIEKIPHDLIGGQPLHYHLTDNGKFVLYSIGWNQTDDGGQPAVDEKGKLSMGQADWALTGITK